MNNKIKLRFNIESYDMFHKTGQPYLIQYKEEIEVDNTKSFYRLILELVDKYIIKTESNLKYKYYWIMNEHEILWNKYFDVEFVNRFIIRNYYDYTCLDIPIINLEHQFHIISNEIHLIICGPGIGDAIGRQSGITFFFHTD